MKKNITTLAVIATLALPLTSCLSTQGASPLGTVEFPESPVVAAQKIVAMEKSGDYLYSFSAVNWGDAVCEVRIYDDKYMKVTYPQTGASSYYCYKFTGDYLDPTLSDRRIGIFGYAVSITSGAVEEIVFMDKVHGGYKFRSIADHMRNDRKYQSGAITWNTFPEAKRPDSFYFLEFFERKGKRLMSRADEVGNKKDIAGKLYCAISEIPGMKGIYNYGGADASR